MFKINCLFTSKVNNKQYYEIYYSKNKSAKRNALKRLNKGRILAGEFTITEDDIYKQWDLQNGLCWYSNIPMIPYTLHNWQCSLERKNPEFGYIRSNIVLVCLEFNGPITWANDKIIKMYNLLQKPHEYIPVSFENINKIQSKHRSNIESFEINNTKFVKCNKCNQIKNINEFQKRLSSGCKSCINLYYKEKLTIPYKFFEAILRDSITRTKHRLEKDNRKGTNDHDIDIEYLIELYQKQNGLCTYSNMPMKFGSNIDYRITIERINPLLGYIKTNICLICWEFNTSSFETVAKNEIHGSSAWSKEKFELFMISLFIRM